MVVTLLLAIYAFKKQELTEGGTIAAIAVGISIFALGGWTWLALMIVFFVSSNFWSKFNAEKKSEASAEFAKTGLRDFWQVSANSLLGALAAAAYFVEPSKALFAAFAGIIATVTADTWATEIGVFDQNPRLVTNGKKVRPGTSGGVSVLGLAATAGASALIAVAAIAFNAANNSIRTSTVVGDAVRTQFVGGAGFIAVIVAAGLAGSLADSLLGATLQGTYYCRKCGKETEKTLHGCGHKTELKKGFKIIDNDAVNFLSSAAGGVLAYALAMIFI